MARKAQHSKALSQTPETQSRIAKNPFFSPARRNRERKFEQILRNILPYLGSDEGKIILAEIMIALKLEGIIGKELSLRDTQMVKTIKESIMDVPERKKQALGYAYRLLD